LLIGRVKIVSKLADTFFRGRKKKKKKKKRLKPRGFGVGAWPNIFGHLKILFIYLFSLFSKKRENHMFYFILFYLLT